MHRCPGHELHHRPPVRRRPSSRSTPRRGLFRRCRGFYVVTWDVRTSRGDIHAEHVVNAGGFWGRDVGRMVGLELPLLAMAHQYILTEPVPEVAEYRRTTGKELPTVVDFG